MKTSRIRTWLIAVSAVFLFTSTASADVATAKKYIEEAKSEFQTQLSEKALKKLELAEAELDGVPDAEKKPVQAEIDELRGKIADHANEMNKKKYTRQLGQVMRHAEESVGNLVTWKGAKAQAEELFKNEEARKLLGKELEDAEKRFQTFVKLHNTKAGVELTKYAQEQLDDLKKMWKEKEADVRDNSTPAVRDSAIRDLTRAISSLKDKLSELPEDKQAEFKTQIAAIEKDFGAFAASSEAAEIAKRLKDGWELARQGLEGWESEEANVTFEQFSHESSEKTSRFGLVRSVQILHKANQWLKYRETDEDYKKYQSVAEVAAAFNVAKSAHDKTYDRIAAAAEAITAEAEKNPLTKADQISTIGRLQDDVTFNLDDKSRSEPLKARLQKLIDDFQNRQKKAKEEGTAWYAASKKAAAEKWPDMKKKFTFGDSKDFDPQHAEASKGKLFFMTSGNRMGWDFKSDEQFPFATKWNGFALAGKYEPEVAKAIAAVEKKMGRQLGDDDEDGTWEIIYRVEGTQAKLRERKHLEVGGRRTDIEYSDPADAAIITIVAAHCGPLAAAEGVGMASESGEIVKASIASGASGYGFFGSLIRLILGLATGILALIWSDYKPLSFLSGIKESLTKPSLILAGVSILWCFVWIGLSGFSGFFALVALALTAMYLAASALGVTKGQNQKIGVILGAACVGFTLLTVLLQGYLWVI